MPLRSTLVLTKLALRLSKALGRGAGTALPGLLSERLQPDLLERLGAELANGVILVTGTNGKTTTTKLLAEMLTAAGERVLTNRAGSNLRRGLLSTLIQSASLGGKIDATIGLFEVDEASLRRVSRELRPRAILVLNLFRDQLDRYGELDTLAALIGEGIAQSDARVFLNADDPLVANLSTYASDPTAVVYFGVESVPGAIALQTAVDSDRCPRCASKLSFSRVFYGHIGHYTCPQGDFSRPQPQVAVMRVEAAPSGEQSFTLRVEGAGSEVTLPLPGTYNLYNAVAALAVAHGLGLDRAESEAVLSRTSAAFGRVEHIDIQGRSIYLLLIKNPAGFTQVIETFLARTTTPKILFAINDNYADGRDISWLWDVPIEGITARNPTCIVAGSRADDMALRLHYADIPARVVNDLPDAVSALVSATAEGETAFILPTYTAMLAVRKYLAARTQLQEVW